ncbi:MAG TPA: biotin--[acetyl-CoA-carboxylase] ligase [Chthonomonas sp.]|uniref:biotin--[acetyl-CoA-carboxylase] ligase n=1 Tax=Chthonomonas sp. TaxID=2282153 RepID=UPI002B4AB981|nr:biotin--[acetyl-CoA-carboxylase] ligase [Chthonomonas sp.]HLI49098.1 biotin--[acetyl-CoA-carboxylase] ligase [Chthonomonas sp.]
MALYHLSSVPSTMDVARDLLHSDPLALQRWDGVLADEQTQGRGQRGRSWFARAGESLCATFFYPQTFPMPSHPHDEPLQRVAMLSILAGVAVAESIHRALLKALGLPISNRPTPSKPDIGLKWPNDLLLNHRKTGGILIELAQLPTGEHIPLIGVGINLYIREFPPELASRATSFLREGIQGITPLWLGAQIAISLKLWAERYAAGGPESVMRRWQYYDRTKGTAYTVSIGERQVRGVAVEVASNGTLLLQLEDGTLFPCFTASSVQQEDNRLDATE